MSCNLTKGRNITCRDTVGGIKAIYFAQFDEVTAYAEGTSTDVGSLVTFTMGASDDIYKYTLKRGTASCTETITGSSENGTVFYTPSVEIMLHKLTKEDQNQIKLLASNRLVIFLELNEIITATGNNVLLALGLENGMELNAGTNATGAAFGDMNGYTWTFDGMERNPMLTVEDYTTTPLDNAGFTYQTIVTS
jgi:hypothetical protein